MEKQNSTAFSVEQQDGGGGSNNNKKAKPMASLGETLAFVFQCGSRIQFLFIIGFCAGVLNGLVYPALAYVFSTSFADISGAAFNGLDDIRDLAFTFIFVGAFALCAALVQNWSFEIVAYHASQNFRLRVRSCTQSLEPGWND